MKKLLYISVLAAMVAVNAKAQQLPLFSQYYYNKFLYNPAFTGTEDMGQAYLIHRSQWKDMPGSPVTYALTVDGPVKSNQIGLGMSLFNDQTDIFNRTGLYTSYSYRWKVNEDHHLTFGLSGGVIDNKIDFARVSARDVNDPLLYNENRRKITMDANFGVGYFFKDLQVGFSIPQLLGNKVKYNEGATSVYTVNKRHFVGSVSYSLMISETQQIRFIPNIMTRYAKGSPFQFDFNANFDWKDMVRAGLSYRHGYAVGMNIGAKVNKNLVAGYTYEYVISPIGAVAGGGHEILLGYRFSGGGRGGDDEQIKRMNENLDRAQMENDSLLRELKKKDQEHSTDIQYLKEEMEKLKKQQEQENNGSSGKNHPPIEEINKNIRAEKAADYQNEDGTLLTPGYYVIMGSFKVKENAQKSKKDYSTKPGYNPTILFNKVRGFYYVNVFYSTDEETALQIMEVLRSEKPDAWVFKME
ncbi:MAG: PorP/SprF family type IX secretion system membrane protein [Flavobacteriales bacterium]